MFTLQHSINNKLRHCALQFLVYEVSLFYVDDGRLCGEWLTGNFLKDKMDSDGHMTKKFRNDSGTGVRAGGRVSNISNM